MRQIVLTLFDQKEAGIGQNKKGIVRRHYYRRNHGIRYSYLLFVEAVAFV